MPFSAAAVSARGFYADSIEEAPLFESPFVVGSEQVVDTGQLSLMRGDSPARQLILVTDSAHAGRPAKADPFNIRDVANWQDPRLLLDQEGLKGELRRRAVRTQFAWQGWRLRDENGEQLQWRSTWDDLDEPFGGFVREVSARDQPFELDRVIKLQEENRWLLIHATRRQGHDPKPSIDVRVDGMTVASVEVPHRNSGQSTPPPIAVPLDRFHGFDGEIELSIRQSPGNPETPVTLGRDSVPPSQADAAPSR